MTLLSLTSTQSAAPFYDRNLKLNQRILTTMLAIKSNSVQSKLDQSRLDYAKLKTLLKDTRVTNQLETLLTKAWDYVADHKDECK